LAITLDAPQTAGSLLLGNSGSTAAGYSLNAAGGSTLTFDNVGGNAAISVAGGTHAINAPLALNDSVTVSVSGALTIGGAIANGANGPMGVTVFGNGNLVLGGPNTYSGNTTLSGGTTALAHPLALQNSTVNTGSGAALTFAAGITSPMKTPAASNSITSKGPRRRPSSAGAATLPSAA
jgi:autotransporter-associated beta strand protein